MRKLDILFTDWGLSRNKIGNVLIEEFDLSTIDISKSLRKEIQSKSKLGSEVCRALDRGQMVGIELIEQILIGKLEGIEGNLILTTYPRNAEQFLRLRELLLSENIALNNIWFFNLRDEKRFMKRHFEVPINKQYLDKYGEEITSYWITKFEEQRKKIESIKRVSDSVEWKSIKMDYVTDLSSKYIIENFQIQKVKLK